MNARQYKEKLLAQLYAPYKNCMQCPLASLGRTTVVFGEGNPDATVMLIGEGPGAQEDAQGRPFVGRSGKLLTRVLEEIANLKRSDIYITNIVKCRPPNNRKPESIESSTCKKILLLNQIKIIRPRIICTLGASALEGLLDREVKISKMRGTTIPFNDALLVPTYHPAYILRNPKELEIFAHDIQRIAHLATNKDA